MSVAASCGGFDCNDSDANISPGATDTVGNGVDDNCDALDGVDADQDGYASITSGGTDCNDSLPAINPGRVNDPIEVTVEEDVELDANIGSTLNIRFSIAADSDGYPHIGYGCNDGSATNCVLSYSEEVRYIGKTASGWSPMYVIAGYGAYVSVDASDNVHVVYNPFSSFSCFDRWRKDAVSGSWSQDTLFCDPDGYNGAHTEAFRPDGQLAVVYRDSYLNRLQYATPDAFDVWKTEDVSGIAQDGNRQCAPKMVVDTAGKAHIASYMCTYFSPEVRYSTNESGAWVTETLAADGVATGFDMDASGVLHLLWEETFNGLNAHYLQKGLGLWTEQTISPLTVGRPFLVNDAGTVYASDPGNVVRTNLSGTWEGGGVRPFDGIHAMTLDPQGRVHVVYPVLHDWPGDFFYYSLRYARYSVTNAVDENCDGK